MNCLNSLLLFSRQHGSREVHLSESLHAVDSSKLEEIFNLLVFVHQNGALQPYPEGQSIQTIAQLQDWLYRCRIAHLEQQLAEPHSTLHGGSTW